MHFVEQRLIGLPGTLARVFRPPKPVRPFDPERTARLARQPPPRGIFPVRGMNDELPDVVPARRRPPGGLRRRDASNRAPKIRAVPRGMIVGLVENRQQESDFRGRPHVTPAAPALK